MNLQQLADQAIKSLQANDWQQSIIYAQQALTLAPNHPELFHILAMACKTGGQYEQSAQAFLHCLSLQPKHAIARGNFANLLYAQGKFVEAEQHYRQTLVDNPQHIDAAKNFSLMLAMKLARYDEAIELISTFKDPVCRLILADILDKKGEHQTALALIEDLLPLAANSLDLLLRKARFQRQLGLIREAFTTLSGVAASDKQHPEFLFVSACLHYDDEHWQKCEAELLAVIEKIPHKLDAHQALNQLYWEQGRDSDFLQSYRRLQHANYTPAVRMSEATALVNAKRLDEAEQLLNVGLVDDGKLPQYLHALGAIASRRDQLAKAEDLMQQAVKSHPEVTRWQLDLANVQIKQGEYKTPQQQLEKLVQQVPNNQEIWAYLGLCWRLQGDERFHWLCDSEHLVDYSPLSIPAHYDNQEHFFSELEIALKALHRATRQPLDQSVDGGTQTMGNLFARSEAVIQDYKVALTKRIETFLQGLPKGDPAHPFYRRLQSSFRFSGAWSVCLTGDGYHTNHVHPEGWLSGPCYVKVPTLCHPNDTEQKGWVTMGETSLNLGDREETLLSLCPARGMSLLFPSYMWHGTRKFSSVEERITAPCDVMPA